MCEYNYKDKNEEEDDEEEKTKPNNDKTTITQQKMWERKEGFREIAIQVHELMPWDSDVRWHAKMANQATNWNRDELVNNPKKNMCNLLV